MGNDSPPRLACDLFLLNTFPSLLYVALLKKYRQVTENQQNSTNSHLLLSIFQNYFIVMKKGNGKGSTPSKNKETFYPQG